jgi:hypothetical protein
MLNADDALKAVFGGNKQARMFEMTPISSPSTSIISIPQNRPGSSGNGLSGFFHARTQW